MRQLLYIARLAWVMILPLLLALTSVRAQTVVYRGDTTSLTVHQIPGDTYSWELYSDGTVDFAKTPGNCPASSAQFTNGNIGSKVNVRWLKTGTYLFKVTAVNSINCTNNLKIGITIVKEALPTAAITPPDPICLGETAKLSVILTGTGPWDVTFTDGIKIWTVSNVSISPYTLIVKPSVTTSFRITQVKDQTGINSTPSSPVTLQVKPKPASSRIYLYQP